MKSVTKLNEELQKRFGGAVRAHEADGCVVLAGELPQWADVVAAGQMAADKRGRRPVVNDIICRNEPLTPMRLPALRDEALAGAEPDVLVIGAGVVGCAVARELARYELDVLLVEKEHDVALQASSRNDGMIHPGIDLLPGQLKRKYNLRGNRMYDRLCRELGVPLRRCGQYLCFRQKWLRPLFFLTPLWWRALGVPARYISRRRLAAREPALAEGLCCAVFFPTAGSVSPYGLTIALAENAVQNGARLSLDTAVTGMTVENGRIAAVETNRGTVRPLVVVNAAGVFAEDIAKLAHDRFYSIHPRRGTNSILDKKAARVRTIASSLTLGEQHAAHTKGGGLVRTADGNVLVGPDARETSAREDYATSADSVRATFEKQRAAQPSLSERDIIIYFTGVRAPTYEEDFVVEKGRRTHNLVHAAGIQSPGLTAAPAIAVDVARMARELVEETRPVSEHHAFNPTRRPIPCPAELTPEARDALIRENPDYGVIVCRCEEISRGEIVDALRRPVPCDTVDGVKRRVRAGMGRCQGGFCGPQVLRIIAEEKGLPLTAVTKNGGEGYILTAPVKEVGDDG